MIFELEKTSIVLNRLFVKNLAEGDRNIFEYSCMFTQNPDGGKEHQAIASVCYQLGVPAIRLGNKIITKRLSLKKSKATQDSAEIDFKIEISN